MKKSIIVIAAIIMMAGLTTKSFAQGQVATESNPAYAKIIAAISLNAVLALDFGTMSVPTAPVNVTVSTTNTRVASVPANIDLLGQAPTFSYATYTVGGEGSYLYTITLPANNVVTLSNGTTTMKVSGFAARTASVPGADGVAGVLSSGADNFTVGATLELGASQAAGSYTGSFDVTVAYN